MREFNFPEGETLLIDKPLEWTSFDVVNKLKFAIRIKKLKIGHAGTLDPLATGLLIICTGKKTKTINDIQAQSKWYEGEFTLGATTPSYDMETEVDDTYPINHITEALLHEKALTFTGQLSQVPPIFSAVSVNGERAYNKARRGESVELKPREITIHSFKITSINLPKVTFEVCCTKGTYIRSLANDFGKALGSGAYLSQLRRTGIGEYKVDDAFELTELVDHLKSLQSKV